MVWVLVNFRSPERALSIGTDFVKNNPISTKSLDYNVNNCKNLLWNFWKGGIIFFQNDDV